jgi:hypothetical protein
MPSSQSEHLDLSCQLSACDPHALTPGMQGLHNGVNRKWATLCTMPIREMPCGRHGLATQFCQASPPRLQALQQAGARLLLRRCLRQPTMGLKPA